MKWTIIELLKLQKKGFIFDEKTEFPDLVEGHQDLRQLRPVQVKGRTDISPDKITFHLVITGEMVLPCARTLADVDFPFQIESTETFLLEQNPYGMEEDDEDYHLVKGDVIDLSPIVRELVLLEIPIQVISEDSEQNEEAPSEGVDWQVVNEQNKQEKIDPRLAKLAHLLNNDDTE
ncbi:YceD family protein [Bacillus carboniphilus]|uniref:YceD family protein n=1 Tax=Bacillus carboniphilus TaxID=86663 RepID=A0ABY9K1C3_9BACI|nr:YceD family protein [Bacillus carboniphilus]WLR43640.1 YceD family protein [Bacillus carboniphilus]